MRDVVPQSFRIAAGLLLAAPLSVVGCHLPLWRNPDSPEALLTHDLDELRGSGILSRKKFPPFKHQKIRGLWRKSKFVAGRVLGQGDTEGPPRRLRSHQCRSDDIGQLHAAAGKLLDFFGQPLDRSSDHTSRAPTSPDSAASLTNTSQISD